MRNVDAFSGLRPLRVPVLLAAGTLVLLLLARASDVFGSDPADESQLSYDQRLAKHQQLGEASDAAALAASRNFLAKGGDPKLLPRAHRMAVASAPPQTLKEALQAADLVVSGEVLDTDFVGKSHKEMPGNLVQFRVSESMKGEAKGILSIQQPGNIEVDPSTGNLVLGYSDYAPVMFPGERYLLFLKRVEGTDRFYVLPYVGQYGLDAEGRLAPLEGNPFAADVTGRTAPDLVNAVAP